METASKTTPFSKDSEDFVIEEDRHPRESVERSETTLKKDSDTIGEEHSKEKDFGQNSSSESPDEEENDNCGLEFSWTKIPSKNVGQSAEAEDKIASGDKSFDSCLLFWEPIVESNARNVNLNDSQFDFDKPHDESMEIDDENSVVTEHKVGVDASLSCQSIKDSCSTDAVSEESKKQLQDEKTMKVVKSNVPDTDVASENDVSSRGEVLRNDKVNESLVKSPTEPMRLKTKYSEDSRNSSNDNSVPAVAEVIKSSSDMDISFKSTNSKASTVSMDTVSSRSEQSEAVRTTISSDLDKLGMISKNSTMTPVRRSRRLSGATPTITPINERSRRVSGASAMSSKSFEPDEKYDTLELRNRTIIETFSPVSDFGINRNSSPMELRSTAVKRNKNSNNTPEISPTSSLGSPRTMRVDQRSPSASLLLYPTAQ